MPARMPMPVNRRRGPGTPVGKAQRLARRTHAVNLVRPRADALVERNGIDPARGRRRDLGRGAAGRPAGRQRGPEAVLAAAGRSIPGTTVDRQCGSSQQSSTSPRPA